MSAKKPLNNVRILLSPGPPHEQKRGHHIPSLLDTNTPKVHHLPRRAIVSSTGDYFVNYYCIKTSYKALYKILGVRPRSVVLLVQGFCNSTSDTTVDSRSTPPITLLPMPTCVLSLSFRLYYSCASYAEKVHYLIKWGGVVMESRCVAFNSTSSSLFPPIQAHAQYPHKPRLTAATISSAAINAVPQTNSRFSPETHNKQHTAPAEN